jgi:hypothetical protein
VVVERVLIGSPRLNGPVKIVVPRDRNGEFEPRSPNTLVVIRG